MRGYPHNNVLAFYAAEDILRALNFDVVNPARVDYAAGLDPTLPISDDDLPGIIMRDIGLLLTCDYIYLLDGWEDSIGACAEVSVARWRGIQRLQVNHEWRNN
jgi:hypothetical protein